MDSAVAGVTYETSPGGFAGVTSATGQYQYAEGDTVVFSIGEIQFPPATAKSVVTPVDMVPSGDTQNQIVKNIAVLLQSLDADGNPGNGISIPAEAVAAATQSVDFNQTYAAFSTDVLPVVQHTDNSKTVVSESAAVAHLEESIEQSNAETLVGTWYIHGQGDTGAYDYVLFIINGSHYATIDHDSSVANGAALEIGTYSWDQATGKVTVTPTSETESGLDAVPPMANNNTLVLDGDTLTLSDANDEFVLTRLKATSESPLKGGWSVFNEEDQVFFAFTDTHYFMGQQYAMGEESSDDTNGWPGVELGTYTHNNETNAFVVDTELDTNGQWGASHPCAVLNEDGKHNNYEQSNYLACGPDGRDIVQTFSVTGDTLTLISEADTIKKGEEDPSHFERVNGLPDGNIHLKLTITVAFDTYTPGETVPHQGGSSTCGLVGEDIEPGYEEIYDESWLLGVNPNTRSWMAATEAIYNPVTHKLTFEESGSVEPVKGHAGFFDRFYSEFEATYNANEGNVITGTLKEMRDLSWGVNGTPSTCVAKYSVIGVLR